MKAFTPFLIVLFLVIGTSHFSLSQCTNTSKYPSSAISAPTSGSVTAISACNYASEYSEISGIAASTNYRITSDITTDFITVRLGTPGGTLVASGVQPLDWTSTTTAGSYFIHYNTNSSCGTAAACRVTAIQHMPATVPMAYSTSTTTQANTSSVQNCSSNQEIIGIQIVTTGSTSPFNATSFKINTTGSTSPAITSNVSNIDIYYTGTSSTFATTTLFGSASPQISGTAININGTQTLAPGTNYFWVVYDLTPSAIATHVLDAQCTEITMNGGVGAKTPSATNPTGSRAIIACLPSPGGIGTSINKAWFMVNDYTSGAIIWNNTATNTNLLKLNSSTAPTYVGASANWNFNPSLSFSGAIATDNFQADITAITDVLGLTEGTLIVVGTYPGSGSYGACGFFGDRGANNDEFSFQSTGTWYRGSNVTGTWSSATVAMGTTPSIQLSKFTNVSSPNIKTFYNSLNNGTANNGTNFSNAGTKKFGIGEVPYAHDFVGSIVEVISLSKNINATEQIQAESYLATKYGITLGVNGTSIDYISSAGTVYWKQATNSAYAYDIAGIARDDKSKQSQLKSHSINKTGTVFRDILTVVNGTSFGSPTSFSTDHSFLVWGHNNLAISNGGVDLPATIEARLKRVWKGQVTGTVGTVTLEFNMIQVPGPPATGTGTNNLNDVRLLVDANGVFATGATLISPSYVDNASGIIRFEHSFTGATGFFFTVGSINLNSAPLPVELASFDASCENGNAILEWTTASETNNDYFTIEKSADAENFTEVAQVEGNGTSATEIKYRWIDLETINEVSYYRLKQTDFNGAFEYHGIRTVTCETNSTFSIYPNPFDNSFTVNLDENTTFPLSLEMYDNSGRKVHSQEIISNNSTIVLADDISKGTYFVKVFNQVTELVGRVIKLN